MEEELEKLEIKVSYLEDAFMKLNEVIIQQEKTLNASALRIEQLEKKVADLIEITGEARPNRKPPHY